MERASRQPIQHHAEHCLWNGITRWSRVTRYVTQRYDPERSEILIGPGRGYSGYQRKVRQIKDFLERGESACEVKTISELYEHYEYRDLCTHRAIIVLPYTTYTGSTVEYLAMGIPVFIPSPDLLTRWHLNDYLLVERTSDLEPTRRSVITGERHGTMPDPNADFDAEAVRYWLAFCEWYGWPIETFDSLEELDHRLRVSDFEAMSRTMLDFDRKQYDDTSLQWMDILGAIQASQSRATFSSLQTSANWRSA